jgi:hypothetical protein
MIDGAPIAPADPAINLASDSANVVRGDASFTHQPIDTVLTKIQLEINL